jgi:hypothetical protein
LEKKQLTKTKRKIVVKDKRHHRRFDQFVIETIQRHYQNDHSMEDIAKVMGMSLASVSKYCRGIERGTPPAGEEDEFESVFKGSKLQAVPVAPISRPNRGELAQQHPVVQERPKEIVKIIEVQPVAGSIGSSSDKPPSVVVRTTRLFSGTLLGSGVNTQLVAFTTPPHKSALVLTASGPIFHAILFTEFQYSQYYKEEMRGDEEDTWRSPKVTAITQELNLPYYGKWFLVFYDDSRSDDRKAINIEVSLETTTSSLTPPAAIPCWVGPLQ